MTKWFRSDKSVKGLFILALILLYACLIGIVASEKEENLYDYQFTLEFTGTQNENSQYNEVWLKGFMVGETRYNANMFGVPEGWKEGVPQGWPEFATHLHASGDERKIGTLDVQFKGVSSLGLIVAKTPYSGKIFLDTEEEGLLIDLYSEQEVFETVIPLEIGKTLVESNVVGELLLSVLALVAVAFLVYRWRCCMALIPVTVNLLVFVIFNFLNINLFCQIFSVVLSVLAGLGLWLGWEHPQMEKYKSKKTMALLLLFSAYLTFAFAGHPIIFKTYSLELSPFSISYLLLFIPLMFTMAWSCLFLLEAVFSRMVENRAERPFEKKGKFWILFFTMCAVYSVWLWIFAPANLTPDNGCLLRMVRGDADYVYGHPVFYYFFVKIIDSLCTSQAFHAFVQFASFSAVCSCILIYLCKRGLRYRFALIFSVVFPLLVPNGIGQVTLVKDYPSTTALLWFTYMLLKFVLDGKSFWTWYNVAGLFISAFLACYLRDNSRYAIYLMVFLLLFVGIKGLWQERKKTILTAVSLGVVLGIGYVAALFGGLYLSNGKADSLVEYRLARMIASNYSFILAHGGHLSQETEEYMEQFMTNEEWISCVYPDISEETKTKEKEFFAKADTGNLVKVLVDSFLYEPVITVKTRMNYTNILWDLTHVSGKTNFYHIRVADVYGYERLFPQNTSWATKHLLSGNLGIINANVLMNPALHGIILMVTAIYCWKNSRKRLLFILSPAFFYSLTLFAANDWQDYRYYYYLLPVCAFFILISTVCVNQQNEKCA